MNISHSDLVLLRKSSFLFHDSVRREDLVLLASGSSTMSFSSIVRISHEKLSGIELLPLWTLLTIAVQNSFIKKKKGLKN